VLIEKKALQNYKRKCGFTIHVLLYFLLFVKKHGKFLPKSYRSELFFVFLVKRFWRSR
jgi:hypothetical protein